MTPKVFANSKRLKYICTLSIGTDHICQEFLKSNKIRVINSPTANVISVAEYIFAYIIQNLKDFNMANKAYRNGTGREGLNHIPFELSSQTIGVVGAGKIAYRFFELLNPFNPKCYCWTFHPENHHNLNKFRVKFIELDELFRKSDFLVIAIPLSEKTNKIIDQKYLSILRKDACIISISRVDVMDIAVFLKLSSEGYFSGSLIDCFPGEVEVKNNEINNICFSPHIAGISRESRLRMALEIVEELIKQHGAN